MTAAKQNKAIATNKQPVKAKTTNELIDRGIEAKTFQKSKENEYLESMIDEIENELLVEKLNIRKDNAIGLHEVCIKIDFLEEIKSRVARDVYNGNRATERQAKEIANEKYTKV